MRVKTGRISKTDVIKKMCNIQREIDDTVVFTVGIRDKGKIIDIINVENTLQKRRTKPEQKQDENQLEVHLPEVPDYVG